MEDLMDMPLRGRTILKTSNPDETYDVVARTFRKHDMRGLGQSRRVDARMNALVLPGVSLVYLHYGVDLCIDVGAFEDFYLLHLNLQGRCRIAVSSTEYVADRTRAILCSHRQAFRFGWEPDSRVLALKIDRETLNRCYQTMSGLTLRNDIEFAPLLDLMSPGGQRWLSLLRFIEADSSHEGGLCGTAAGAAQLADLLLTSLLAGHDSSHRAQVLGAVSPAAPRYVKRAEDYMRANLDRALTLSEIAAHVGVSIRSLSNGFRDFRGLSPMAYATHLRLEQAHETLQAAEPGTSVTGVAHQWGFHHLSNFSSLYRRRYGQRPADTLRQSRR